MGVGEFFLIVALCCIFAFLLCLLLTKLGAPPLVNQIVWGVAILIIVVTLLKALGAWGYDPQIPRIFGR